MFAASSAFFSSSRCPERPMGGRGRPRLTSHHHLPVPLCPTRNLPIASGADRRSTVIRSPRNAALRGRPRLSMPKRKLLIALTVAGLFVAAFGSSTCPRRRISGRAWSRTVGRAADHHHRARVHGRSGRRAGPRRHRLGAGRHRPAPTNPPPAPEPPVTIDAQTAPSQGGSPTTTGSNSTPSSTTPAPTQEPAGRPSRTRSRPPARPAATLRSRSRVRSRPAATRATHRQGQGRHGQAQGRRAHQRRRQPRRHEPEPLARAPRPGADRRAELLHRQVPHPAVPAADLPGRRHRVRRALGGPRRDQRDRDRLRPQPQRLLRRRRRAGCSSCPSTWKQYGVDANQDGSKDPFNPVDAIFAAARYLQGRRRRQGPPPRDLRLQPRRLVRRLRPPARAADRRPARPTSSARSPASPRAASPSPPRHATPTTLDTRTTARRAGKGNAAVPVVEPGATARASTSSPAPAPRRSPSTTARSCASATASASASFIMLQRRLRQHLHVRAPEEGRRALPGAEAADGHATRRSPQRARAPPKADPQADRARQRRHGSSPRAPRPPRKAAAREGRRREAAAPRADRAQGAPVRQPAPPARACEAGGEQQLLERRRRSPATRPRELLHARLRPQRARRRAQAARKVGRRSSPARSSAASARPQTGTAPHMLFEIRPAGRGAPRIDPKPILDGWKLLESTAIYRAAGKNPFFGPDAKTRRSARSC